MARYLSSRLIFKSLLSEVMMNAVSIFVTITCSPVALPASFLEILFFLGNTACIVQVPELSFENATQSPTAVLESLWGDYAYREPRTIDVHVRHLREKIESDPHEPALIQTVRGVGYRLRG